MKSKKSVLIIIFSLLLTLAFPVKVKAGSFDDYEYVYAYTAWNYIVIDNYYFIGGQDDELLDYYLRYFYSPYIDIRKRAFLHDSSSLAVVLALEGFSISSYDNSSSSDKLFLDWLYDNSPNIPSLYTHFSMSEVPPSFSPTPIPSFVPEATPIPTYVPGGGGGGVAPSYTPVPLPPLEGDYFLFGVETDNFVHFGSDLPSEVVFAVPSSSYSLTSTYYEVKFSIPSSFVLHFMYNYNDRFSTSVGVAQSDSRYLSNDVLTVVFYPNGITNPNNFSVTWEYGYIPTPRPTYTPVPLPQSTPIPTFNPNAPINPDFDYNLGQSVEFGQLPILFSNVSELSYLFVTPFEFLVTNMWERWYILFLFPIVAIISAFIWERRD